MNNENEEKKIDEREPDIDRIAEERFLATKGDDKFKAEEQNDDWMLDAKIF